MAFLETRLGYVLCAVNPVTALAIIEWDPDPWGRLAQAVLLPIMAVFIACPQISAVLIIRKTRSPWTQWFMLALSFVAAIDYVRVVLPADLTGSSTAALVVAYSLLSQPVWVLPIGAGLVWLGSYLNRHTVA